MKIDAQDITGERFAFNLTGLPARVFQHEYDHLLVSPWHPLVLLLQFTCYFVLKKYMVISGEMVGN